MRMLLVNYEYPPIGAGAANAAWYMAHELSKAGNEVTVLTSGYKGLRGRRKEDGVTVCRIPAIRCHQEKSNMGEMASFLLSAAACLPVIAKQERIDSAIVFFSLPCGPLGLLARYLLGVPYVVSLRGGDVPGNEPGLGLFHTVMKPLRRLILKSSLAVVANSKGLKDLSESVDPHPVLMIPNGVDTGYFSPAKRNADSPFRFLFVGRFQVQKNLHFLLGALDTLASETSAPFEISLAGDGPQRRDLEAHARSLGIRDRITWHGWCDKAMLKTLYQTCDCLLNPSLYEGMPNVLLEAMSCGMPVIASNVMGNNELVSHGENGFLFDLDAPESFLHALKKAVEEPDTIRRMGEHAREYVEGAYSWKSVADQYARLFHKNMKEGQNHDA